MFVLTSHNCLKLIPSSIANLYASVCSLSLGRAPLKSSLRFGADSPQQHASYAEEISSRPSRIASIHTSLLRLPTNLHTNHPTTDHTG